MPQLVYAYWVRVRVRVRVSVSVTGRRSRASTGIYILGIYTRAGAALEPPTHPPTYIPRVPTYHLTITYPPTRYDNRIVKLAPLGREI